MLAVNLGTRGVQEALDLLEYCNIPGGTAWSDARRANGAPDPYHVKMWCLGNEMDGPWQIGGTTAEEYGRLATQTARAMRLIDPSLELVVCGSSGPGMPTFGAWEREVLTQAYEDIDFVSAHSYYQERDGDLASFLASGVEMDDFIDSLVATCDHVKAARKLTKPMMISFDEWNVWYSDGEPSKTPTEDWPVAPHLLEDAYSVTDAVVVGGLLISLLRHSDRVRSACLAQLVNVIASIMTETGGPAWRQTIFHPFALTAKYAVGEVLKLTVSGEQTDTEKYGSVDAVDAVATWDEESGQVAMFLLNRDVAEPATVEVDLRSLGAATVQKAVVLSNANRQWKATAADSASVGPRTLDEVRLDEGRLQLKLPALSWSMVVLKK
jgi:alpha-N-arabinofuranosidase